MKMLELKKQKDTEPKFDELTEMLSGLEDFLETEANPGDLKWVKNLSAIVDFQDDDGSFKLFDSYNIPSDARVDFCWIPTYLCSAILMKAYMTDCESFTMKEKSALTQGLKMSCGKKLRGHGYEAFKGQIEALKIFMKAGLKEFIDLHPDLCPEFSEMIFEIISKFKKLEEDEKFTGQWGESYEDDIKLINQYFCERQVLVYGTLMSGETNHGHLRHSTPLGACVLEGYEMYDVGWYPAIIEGDGFIIGELYQVPVTDIPSIDTLEGEGSLYEKKCVRIAIDGKPTFAFVYVYLRDCSDLKRIASWKEYLWYVAYGSNMLEERFSCYIKGGSFESSRYRAPCKDSTLPLAIKSVEIPFDMYFGNYSGSWQGTGVSFLDTSKEGHALGVAYLISKEQFEHVACEENAGRCPGDGEWYEDIIELEEIDGFKAVTITNNELRDYNEPSITYLNTLKRGIRKSWPEMSDAEIEDYLLSCIR